VFFLSEGDIEIAVALTIIFLAFSAIYLSMLKKPGLKAGGSKKEEED